MAESPEAVRFFEHLVTVFHGTIRRRTKYTRDSVGSQEFEPGRDPRSLGSILNRSISERGWTPILSKASVIAQWADLVGPEVAAHATPDISGKTLTITCDSSAWATQLRLLRHDIATELLTQFPDCGIDDIEVLGPGVNPIIRGPRRVKGRGPRDTYG